MKITVILCHYKSKIVAYTVSQLIKYKGEHELEILVVNNSKDDSYRYLEPFYKDVKLFSYPDGITQSHGCGYDFLMQHVNTDYVICLENDSFPIKEGWLDYYQLIIDNGYDLTGSIMTLSGGTYFHPVGSLIKVETYKEALKYVETIPYHYLPNAAMKEGFPNHVMIHNDIWDFFLQKPEAFVELPDGCKVLSKEQWLEKERYYSPIAKGVFHQGMGSLNETIHTYGQRNFQTGIKDAIIDGKERIIYRMGEEPGQFLSYWMLANRKMCCELPTEIKWMLGREGQQQEYTLTENGIHHCWGLSSYMERPAEGVEDIYKEKRELPEKLYNSMPDEYKIKTPVL